MKILQITPSYKPAYIYGGPTMSVAKLCEALVQHNLDLEVLTTTANGKTELNVESGEKISVDGVPATYFKRITKDHTHFSPALLLGLREKIKEQKTKNKDLPPVIHIHSWWNLVTIFSCLMAKIYHIPVVLSPRGMLTAYTQNNRNSLLKSILHTLIGKSLLRYCHIIASSEQEQQDLLQIIMPKSITIIPNLVSLPHEQGARSKEQGTPFNLLFLSRIEEKKGLDILFEALANLNIKWTLNIGGNGDEEYIKNLKLKAKNLKINDNIHWLGHINNQDKFELMANHDLLVLTSHNENFANVVIESLSVGTPVLLSKQVGLSSYVAANDLGFVTDLNSNQITTTLNDAYTNLGKRDRIRLSASQMIKDDFNEEKLIKKYINLYQEILNLKSS